MNILKINTAPEFEIIPRGIMVGSVIELKNENNQKKQNVNFTFEKLPNENYKIILATFPNGKQGDKLSYSIPNVCNGKILIVSQTENIQDYSKKSNNKFYK